MCRLSISSQIERVELVLDILSKMKFQILETTLNVYLYLNMMMKDDKVPGSYPGSKSMMMATR